MTVLINNAVLANNIFYAILIVALLISLRPRRDNEFFPVSVSRELKGLAILTIVFVHVAYALVSDNRFLLPLSNMSGLGVDTFLFLSGYGLMMSTLRRESSVWQFYKYRLFKLYSPFWLTITAFFCLDIFLLKITYSWTYIAQSFLGFFNHADLYTDINSPLWYFTLIIFYYFIFPWLLVRKKPWLSAIFIYAISFLVISLQPPFLNNVLHLYKLHTIAFPLGVLLAAVFSESVLAKASAALQVLRNQKHQITYNFLLFLSLATFIYSVTHSGVGETPMIEQLTSIVSMLLLCIFFILKRFEIKTLYILGLFSYEIYLLHWPIMYRYDFLFKYLPVWLALSLYFVVFIGLGWLMQRLFEGPGKKA
ncbi:MAG: acyltransferase [Patescibacteria group bacterium]